MPLFRGVAFGATSKPLKGRPLAPTCERDKGEGNSEPAVASATAVSRSGLILQSGCTSRLCSCGNLQSDVSVGGWLCVSCANKQRVIGRQHDRSSLQQVPLIHLCPCRWYGSEDQSFDRTLGFASSSACVARTTQPGGGRQSCIRLLALTKDQGYSIH